MFTNISTTWTTIVTWVVSALQSLLGILVDSNGDLTLLGEMSVASLGLAVILLLFNIILDFFHFRR